MTLRSDAVFLERPRGQEALQVGGGTARPAAAVRASLKTADGGVLVKSIAREPDGTYTGVVYGVMPGQRGVAPGDRVRFAESQIYTFKTAETESADAEMSAMIRSFEEGFGEAHAPGPKDTVAADPAIEDFAFDPAVFEDAPPAAGAAAARTAEGPAKPAEASAHPEPTVEEAIALLRASEPRERAAATRTREPRQAREPVPPPREPQPARRTGPPREPQRARKPDVSRMPDPTRVPQPLHVPETQEETSMNEAQSSAANAGDQKLISCMECGATLVIPPPAPEEETQAPRKIRVTCRSCGRINDVAEAEETSARRQVR